MSYSLNLVNCEPVNYLWIHLSESLGIDKATQAVRQAIDLQAMNGSQETLPVLFFETCGIALGTLKSIRSQTDIPLHGDKEVLLFSHKQKVFQILYEKK